MGGLLTTVDRRGADAGVRACLQVTPDNFAHAESDMQFMTVVKRSGWAPVTGGIFAGGGASRP